MNNSSNIVVADGHLHLYPVYDLKVLFRNLILNLNRLAGAVECADSGPTGNGIYKLAFLTESRELDFFSRLKNQDKTIVGNGIEITRGPDPDCVTVGVKEIGQVCLVAGRQIVTRERLEILGLAMREKIQDGLPAGDIIKRVVAAGGIPVIPWAPGKWFFARGQLVKDLIESDQGRVLRLGDSILRPTLWPDPKLMRLARERGLTVIPGSDPLPFAGEERYAGTYGFMYRGAFDPVQPTASARQMLAGPSSAIIPVGARCGSWAVAQRLHRLQATKDGLPAVVPGEGGTPDAG